MKTGRAFHRMLPRAATALILLLAGTTAARANWLLTVEPVEDAGMTPVTARVSIIGSDSLARYLLPDSAYLHYSTLGGYFYADPPAAVAVPPGATRIRAAKGPEFIPVDVTVNVQSDTVIQVALHRWIEPRLTGWVGGEGHADLTHPPVQQLLNEPRARLAATAEGLRVTNFLDNGFLFLGVVDPLSDTAAVLFSAEEYRTTLFGHLGFLGIDSYITPDWSSSGWPVNGDVTAQVRTHQSAISVYVHPATTDSFFDTSGWPGTGLARGIWIDAPLGMMDAMDVLSYSNEAAVGKADLSTWYRLWNCGFTIPGSAGSDITLAQIPKTPIGGMRVYVNVPDPYAPPQTLYDSWIDGIRRGRTYIATGPLITDFDVGRAGAGETLHVADGMPVDVRVTGRFESARALKQVELVVNGAVTDTFDANYNKFVDIDVTVRVRETSWIALRHYAYDYGNFVPNDWAIAQPTPALVLLDGDEPRSKTSADGALLKTDMLAALLDHPVSPARRNRSRCSRHSLRREAAGLRAPTLRPARSISPTRRGGRSSRLRCRR